MVGELDGRDEPIGVERQLRVEAIRPREIAIAVGGLEERPNRFDRQVGRDLACLMPAHTVGHDEQAAAHVPKQRVFVGGTHQSRMRHAVGVESQRSAGPRG